MSSLSDIGMLLEAPPRSAEALLQAAEQTLEHWVTARGFAPTDERREGFRLLALHRQGCKGDPSFNACRETCRELAWHYNLLTAEPCGPQNEHRLTMMQFVARHLYYFVSGKLEETGLGEFCCSSRPLRGHGG